MGYSIWTDGTSHWERFCPMVIVCFPIENCSILFICHNLWDCSVGVDEM